jgi:hypothetical protein
MRNIKETFEKPLDVRGQIDRIGQNNMIEDSTGHLKGLSIGNQEIGVANPAPRSGDLVCGKIDPSFQGLKLK